MYLWKLMRCGNQEVILFLPFLTLLLISLTFLLNCRYGADASIGPPVTLKMGPQAIVWITVWEEKRRGEERRASAATHNPLMSSESTVLYIFHFYYIYIQQILPICYLYLFNSHSVTNYSLCMWFIFWMPESSHRTRLFPVQLSFRKNVSVDLQKEQCGIKS